MGKVVRLKPDEFYGEPITAFVDLEAGVELERLRCKIERQAREIKKFRARNKALIGVINSQHYQHIALLNHQMRRSMRLTTCTPERADFLRANDRDR